MRNPNVFFGSCLLVAAVTAGGLGGCQNPDAFYRDGGGTTTGTGGHATTGTGGSGGSTTTGAGGSGGSTTTGSGGRGGTTTTGAGGATTGAGGATTGAGGKGGTGGSTGAGGAGGMAVMPCTTCKVKVQYSCRSDDTQAISFIVNIVNNAASAVPLADVTVRYWYTADAAKMQDLNCDYAKLGCTNVVSGFKPVMPAKAKASQYAEIGFGTGAATLDGFNESGEIQIRVHNMDYSTIDQTDDYSFDCLMKGMLVEAPKITAYVKGTLVWGTEPQ